MLIPFIGLLLAVQTPAPAPPPAFKGVWESVSFSEDLEFKEVFFASVNKGWVAGAKGTIIHTKDAGRTWTAQLGGDPAVDEKPVTLLRFLDESRGWAVKGSRILRTVDGESWDDFGTAPNSVEELAMSSPTEGVAAGHVGFGTLTTLFKTRDGGKTWKPLSDCTVKALVAGLTQNVSCKVIRIQFVTPSVGYLVAASLMCNSCPQPPILGKTEDGGETWRFFVGPGDADVVGATDLFFTDENTGIVRTTDEKLFRTADGGASWTSLLATVERVSKLSFADPEVGWALGEHKISFSVDGGRRWTTRGFAFPAWPVAWSFPRRDRAYVVGDHGMVFRYSVVPMAQPLKPAAQVAPAMPAFGSPLEALVLEVAGVVQDLTAVVDLLPDSAAAAAPAAAAAEPPDSAGASSQDAAPPSAFMSNCCGKPVNRFNAVLGMVLQGLPQFVAKFKNTNLLVAGLRMLVTMPAQLGDLRGAFRDFKSATDKQGAQAALARLGSAASSLRESTRTAFQKEGAP